jgi:hypothetical protein
MWDGRVETFIFPNSDTKGTDWQDYHITE